MNRLLIFGLSGLLVSFVFFHNAGVNCELRTKINKPLRDLPSIEELKHHTHKTLGNPLHSIRSAHKKRDSSTDSIPQLAKNIQSFLQKIIPNHSLVQDLMGYVTMPNPNARKIRHY